MSVETISINDINFIKESNTDGIVLTSINHKKYKTTLKFPHENNCSFEKEILEFFKREII